MTLISCRSTLVHWYFVHSLNKYSWLTYLCAYVPSIQIYYSLTGCHLHTIYFIYIFFIHSIIIVVYFIWVHMSPPHKFIITWLVAISITFFIPWLVAISMPFITRCWSRYAYIGTNTVSYNRPPSTYQYGSLGTYTVEHCISV